MKRGALSIAKLSQSGISIFTAEDACKFCRLDDTAKLCLSMLRVAILAPCLLPISGFSS